MQGAGSRQMSAAASSAGTSAWGTRPVKRDALADAGGQRLRFQRRPPRAVADERQLRRPAGRGRAPSAPAAPISSSTPSWLSMLPRKSRRGSSSAPPRASVAAAKAAAGGPLRTIATRSAAHAAAVQRDLAVGLVGGDHHRRAAEGEALEAAQHGGDPAGCRTSPRTAPGRGRGGRRRPCGPSSRARKPTPNRVSGGLWRWTTSAPRSSSAAPAQVEVGVGDRVLAHEAGRASPASRAGGSAARGRRATRSRRGWPVARGAHHRDRVPGGGEALGLGADAHVLRVGVVLEQHHDAGHRPPR